MAIVEKNVKKPLFSFSRNPFYLIGTVLFVTTWLFPFLGQAYCIEHSASVIFFSSVVILCFFWAIDLQGKM